MGLVRFIQRADDAGLFAYVGRTGSGKTLFMYDYMLEALACGHEAFGNLRPHWENCKRWCKRRYGRIISEAQYRSLDDGQCKRFWEHAPVGRRGRKVVGLFDEAREFLDTRQQRAEEFESAIVHQRKVHIEILFGSQRFSYLLPRIRGELHGVTYLRDVRRLPGLQLIWPSWWHLVHFIECEQAEMRLIEARRGFNRVPRALYGVYNTEQLHGHAQALFRNDVVGEWETKPKGKKMSAWAKGASAAALGLSVWSGLQVRGMRAEQAGGIGAAVEEPAADVEGGIGAAEVQAAQVQPSEVWEGLRAEAFGFGGRDGARYVVRASGRIDREGELTQDGVLVQASRDRLLYDSMGRPLVVLQGARGGE